jgi:hypothetical protein
MKAETTPTKDREAVKLRRKQRDLKHLINILNGASRFASATNQNQWIIDRINDLSVDMVE